MNRMWPRPRKSRLKNQHNKNHLRAPRKQTGPPCSNIDAARPGACLAFFQARSPRGGYRPHEIQRAATYRGGTSPLPGDCGRLVGSAEPCRASSAGPTPPGRDEAAARKHGRRPRWAAGCGRERSFLRSWSAAQRACRHRSGTPVVAATIPTRRACVTRAIVATDHAQPV
jgi:hypothetical protein